MYKILIVGLLILLSFVVFLGADSPPIIVLKPGMNEISIKVQNKFDFDFKSIHVVVKEEDLPGCGSHQNTEKLFPSYSVAYLRQSGRWRVGGSVGENRNSCFHLYG